jgi:hypothetical protein
MEEDQYVLPAKKQVTRGRSLEQGGKWDGRGIQLLFASLN